MILWLHKQGYNYFSIPKLTYPEINVLVDSCSRGIKREEKEMKKQQRKSKRGRYR